MGLFQRAKCFSRVLKRTFRTIQNKTNLSTNVDFSDETRFTAQIEKMAVDLLLELGDVLKAEEEVREHANNVSALKP